MAIRKIKKVDLKEVLTERVRRGAFSCISSFQYCDDGKAIKKSTIEKDIIIDITALVDNKGEIKFIIPGFDFIPEHMKYNPVVWATNEKGTYLLYAGDPTKIYVYQVQRHRPRFRRERNGKYSRYKPGKWIVDVFQFDYDKVEHVMQYSNHFDIVLK